MSLLWGIQGAPGGGQWSRTLSLAFDCVVCRPTLDTGGWLEYSAGLIASTIAYCVDQYRYSEKVPLLYTVSRKKEATWCLIITLLNVELFQNSFTSWFVRKLSMSVLQRFPPHLQYVGTLPCESRKSTNQLVKEFWISVHICQNYYQTSSGFLFWTQCTLCSEKNTQCIWIVCLSPFHLHRPVVRLPHAQKVVVENYLYNQSIPERSLTHI